MKCVICKKLINKKRHHSYTWIGKRKVGACGEHTANGEFDKWIDSQLGNKPEQEVA